MYDSHEDFFTVNLPDDTFPEQYLTATLRTPILGYDICTISDRCGCQYLVILPNGREILVYPDDLILD